VNTTTDFDLKNLTVAVDDVIEVEHLPEHDLDMLAERWLSLRDSLRTLSVVVDAYAIEIGKRLEQVPYVKKDGYRLRNGELIHHQASSTERWDGRKVLGAISTDMIDPTSGEVAAAVPLKVLASVIPGVSGSSSRWLLAGLRNLDLDPDDFREREWKPAKAQIGPGR
jgi:hypothetical protein